MITGRLTVARCKNVLADWQWQSQPKVARNVVGVSIDATIMRDDTIGVAIDTWASDDCMMNSSFKIMK